MESPQKRFKQYDEDLTDYDDEGRQISPPHMMSTIHDVVTDEKIIFEDNPFGTHKICELLNSLYDEAFELKIRVGCLNVYKQDCEILKEENSKLTESLMALKHESVLNETTDFKCFLKQAINGADSIAEHNASAFNQYVRLSRIWKLLYE